MATKDELRQIVTHLEDAGVKTAAIEARIDEIWTEARAQSHFQAEAHRDILAHTTKSEESIRSNIKLAMTLQKVGTAQVESLLASHHTKSVRNFCYFRLYHRVRRSN